MLASLKSNATKLKSSVINKSNTVQRWIRKYRKPILITLLVLSLIALTVALVMQAYRGVGITNQANIINYTQQRILNDTYVNQVLLIGLNSIFFEVPRRKFIIYFEDQNSNNSEYWSPKMTARSMQGTKLVVSARVSCQVGVNILKDFLQQYGLNWRTYAIQKSKNVIIQNIAATKFYDLNNSLIISKVNAQFQKYKSSLTNYPFTFKLIGLQIQYPPGSFSYTNSLGVALLTQKSLLTQLTTNYNLLNNKILQNTNQINTLSAAIGELQSQIKTIQLQTFNLDPYWIVGLRSLTSAFGNDNDGLRRYLWLYFQKVYNATYNNYTLF